MATTEQLMAQYGVAWFDFDESSGNVTDKIGLGGYVGTVTGATRATGWDGKDSSLNFNGSSQYVLTDYTPSALEEFTVKLKFKCPTNGGGYLFTAGRQLDSSALNINGFGVTVNKTDGNLRVLYWFNSTSAVITNQTLNYDYRDNKWHELILTQKSNVIQLYIDETFIGIYRSIANIITPKNPLRLGYLNVSGYQEWYSGQLDDLQIYNKALSPSDFTKKRLVVKTTDNKNLVLSPTLARVKEIPNTAEYMMLAQGGVVREIDSAVDSQPIDFTKPTTEYEFVTNNRTPLGKGRMFTIPISGDFKTAMIEDNY
ncbi:LamG domain-containing protein [Lysinibacillus sphaericus]|uniref:LamG domain-containing protein n=1 Tax=Lysinibacillus sphaericus TaxID=1421 RepID=UPI0019103318|nr:LamG domain-containing protein [Lysinibacillus sphaericus]QPA55686.1 LamG domain-containing protein [Lysinibacillus sphaericus]